MTYQPKFRTEKTKKLFGIHQKLEAGRLSKEKAMEQAAALGYTSGGASSWFSWWKARARELLDSDATALKAKSQARMAKKLKDTAGKMRAAAEPTPALAVKPETRQLKKRA